MSTQFRPFHRARQRRFRRELPGCQAEGISRRKHAGSLEALRVTRPEAVDLEGIKHWKNELTPIRFKCQCTIKCNRPNWPVASRKPRLLACHPAGYMTPPEIT